MKRATGQCQAVLCSINWPSPRILILILINNPQVGQRSGDGTASPDGAAHGGIGRFAYGAGNARRLLKISNEPAWASLWSKLFHSGIVHQIRYPSSGGSACRWHVHVGEREGVFFRVRDEEMVRLTETSGMFSLWRRVLKKILRSWLRCRSARSCHLRSLKRAVTEMKPLATLAQWAALCSITSNLSFSSLMVVCQMDTLYSKQDLTSEIYPLPVINKDTCLNYDGGNRTVAYNKLCNSLFLVSVCLFLWFSIYVDPLSKT